MPDPSFIPRRVDDTDLEPEVAQRAAHVALDVHQLALDKFATGQQHPLLLGSQRLHMYRLDQAPPHHLRNPTCIVAVGLVDLLRRQQSLHMPGFDAHDGEPGLGQTIHQPL